MLQEPDEDANSYYYDILNMCNLVNPQWLKPSNLKSYTKVLGEKDLHNATTTSAKFVELLLTTP